MIVRKSKVLGLTAAVVMAAATWMSAQQPAAGGGQGRGAQQTPQNLQVLPKDIQRQDLLNMMRGFNQALGVQCNFCHVAEGQGGRNDYAADEKAPKKAARAMIQMTMHANEMVPTAVGKTPADATRVQCWTCHRGERTPSAPPALPAPAAPGGGGGGGAAAPQNPGRQG